MIDHYEDDSHFCLKCRITILGLDNYVAHRKSNCDTDGQKSIVPSELLPQDESFNLKADDFFLSLELQSSAKKLAGPSTSGKQFSGILTRSKISAAIQGTAKEELPQSKSGKNAWIGGHQLKELGTGDNHSKLLKAVDNLSRHATVKKEELISSSRSNIRTVSDDSDEDSNGYDSEDDEYEDDEQDYPPKNHTGGKWKPSSPIQWSSMPSTSGGKWKPGKLQSGQSPPPGHTKGKWKPSSPVTSGGKTNFELPPPSFTGSKWTPSKATKLDYEHYQKPKCKPNVELRTIKKGSDDEEFEIVLEDKSEMVAKEGTVRIPSPTYTKGKWKPVDDEVDNSPFRKSGGTIQYWCNPCSRRLASKLVYERHLKSDLHRKRAMHDFDEWSNQTQVKSKRQLHKSNQGKASGIGQSSEVTRKPRQKVNIKCTVCCSRVHYQKMGKHLISHYHCRRGNVNTPSAHQLILDNIHSITLQSPYQCGPCQFYFNNQQDFLKHWLTPQHVALISKLPGFLYCTFCNKKCSNNNDMYFHLLSKEHNEVISVINRSVPIVIKKYNPVTCSTCNQQFLFNIQLIMHCRRDGHVCSKTSSDKYQNKHKCVICKEVLNSKIALQRHVKLNHNQTIYFCTVCSEQFASKDDVKIHRATSEHRQMEAKLGISSKYKCDYCQGNFDKLGLFREHMVQKHPDHLYCCSQCGKSFPLSQDLSIHLRSKLCTFVSDEPKKANACDTCPYSTDSLSELIYHKILHSVPVETDKSLINGKIKHYRCPFCEKVFEKATMRSHVHVHTNERPYPCTQCSSGFVRKSNLVHHMKLKHSEDGQVMIERNEDGEKVNKYLCSMCGACFNKKSILQNHMLRHTGNLFSCPEPDCITTARTIVEINNHIKTAHSELRSFGCTDCDYYGKTKQQLKRHMTIHSGAKKFQCPHCDFAARLSSNLKRHQRLHTGVKPYHCPHCNYKCNNLENLRKHVLSTSKHPGKCIYECKFCELEYQSNSAKEFRVHLATDHATVFHSGSQAAAYITNIVCSTSADSSMDVDPDEKETDEDDPGVLLKLDYADPVVSTHSAQEDLLFPRYVVSKEDIAENHPDSWNMTNSYDVDDTRNLVSFHTDGESIFHEHFQ